MYVYRTYVCKGSSRGGARGAVSPPPPSNDNAHAVTNLLMFSCSSYKTRVKFSAV